MFEEIKPKKSVSIASDMDESYMENFSIEQTLWVETNYKWIFRKVFIINDKK